jgi:tRNA pseudouridine13 synthase
MKRNALSISECESNIGLEVYGTKASGIGGKIKLLPEDFIVKEILTNGSLASDNAQFDSSGQGEHIVCVLKKKGWDTLLATRAIAKDLDIGWRKIRFAGIKDKNALTYQFISVWNLSAVEIRRLNINDIEVAPAAYSRRPINSNELLGNSFHIIIRQIAGEEHELLDRVKLTHDELNALGGAPNFFGHQRFGITRPVTHLVGLHLVRGEFGEAVKTYLAFNKLEKTPRDARKMLSETWDYEQAFRNFPKSLVFEHVILRYLSSHKGDFVGAIRALPNRLEKLFVQAYQSYLFNRILSRRITLGIPINEAQIGDYVMKTNENGLPSNEATVTDASNIAKINSELKSKRTHITIPLIGFNTILSSGVQGEIEHKVLGEENFNSKNFLIKEMPELSQAGGFRSAIAPLRRSKSPELFRYRKNNACYALLLDFDLPKAAYATVVLREFMKPVDPISAGF